MAKKYDTATFIDMCSIKHSKVYDYAETEYKGSLCKIRIKCLTHGFFEQRAHDHLNGRGCPKCAYSDKSISYLNNNWVSHMQKRFDHIDYSNTVYNGARQNIIAECRTHGIFTQSAKDHAASDHGCPSCGKHMVNKSRVLSFSNFLVRAREKHHEIYEYVPMSFISTVKKMEIICTKHGVFKQTPASHLAGSGCPRCRYRISKPAFEWLMSLKISKLIFEHPLSTGSFADGFDPDSNTVYWFHGDYWHGNPTVYCPDQINPTSKKTYGELYERTITAEQKALKAGYNVVSMWEKDWATSQSNPF